MFLSESPKQWEGQIFTVCFLLSLLYNFCLHIHTLNDPCFYLLAKAKNLWLAVEFSFILRHVITRKYLLHLFLYSHSAIYTRDFQPLSPTVGQKHHLKNKTLFSSAYGTIEEIKYFCLSPCLPCRR